MSSEERFETPPESVKSVSLDSPAVIVPAQKEAKKLPSLPHIDTTPPPAETLVSSSIPPEVPPRGNTAEASLPISTNQDEANVDRDAPPALPPRSPTSIHGSQIHSPQTSPRSTRGPTSPHSQRSVKSPRSTKHHKQDLDKKLRKDEQIAKSLVENDTSYYLITKHPLQMKEYKLFLRDQELLKEGEGEHILKNFFDEPIDIDFWKLFLSDYDESYTITDLTLLEQTEAEFNKLSDAKLRHFVYLALTHSDIMDDELFNSLQIDISADQKLFLEELDGTSEVKLLFSKLITVEDELPHQFIVQIASELLKVPGFTVSEVFKVIVNFNFQFKILFQLNKQKESEYNVKYLFQMSRALEDNCLRFLLQFTEAVKPDDVLSMLGKLLTDPDFWVAFFKHVDGKPFVIKFLDSILLKGFEMLIILMTKLISRLEKSLVKLLKDGGYDNLLVVMTSDLFFNPLNDDEFFASKDPIHLHKYKREYKLITSMREILFPKKSNEKLSRAKTNHTKLAELNDELEVKYNQILSNYQKLNEEKFSNETYIKKLAAEKNELMNESRLKSNDYDTRSQNIEILKINNKRNEEVDKANESLTTQIGEMNQHIEDLRMKLTLLKESKRRR